MDRKTKVVAVAALFGSAAVLGVFSVGAWYLATGDTKVAGDLGSAIAAYEPTSVWIEEGLDPNVTTFGFESGTTDAPAGPELGEGELHGIVRARQGDLMTCYASALQENDELQGRVAFQFGVAPDGHLAMVKVTDSTLRSKSAEDCMVAQARRWAFPRTNRSTLMKFDTDFTFVYE